MLLLIFYFNSFSSSKLCYTCWIHKTTHIRHNHVVVKTKSITTLKISSLIPISLKKERTKTIRIWCTIFLIENILLWTCSLDSIKFNKLFRLSFIREGRISSISPLSWTYVRPAKKRCEMSSIKITCYYDWPCWSYH